jgi:ATP-binding cassette subfamily F protein 3
VAAEEADDGNAMAEAHQAIAEAGGFEARPKAQALLMGLGFRIDQVDDPVDSFSGGWRMRLQLARALMCPADLMLLDEPTNHLDLDALVWLEAWLQRYEGTMIVISHDREFLDAITRVTVHLDEAKLTRYTGNYTAFEEMRAERLLQAQANFAKQQERMAHLQKFIDRFKAKASKAKQAQSRVKALERMERVAPLLAEADFTFEFKEPGNIPNPMLSISNASFGYEIEDAEPKTILRGVSRSVLAGQRIGILGANGQGKSTLVKTIAREMGALAGQVTEGKGLNIGYFAQQELDVLRPQDNPLEHMVRMARELGSAVKESTGEQALRGFLGSFNFSGDMVKQPVGTMSGGEKARLVLAMMVWQRPNLLLLDEPTNHLDLATREALAVALNEFEGTLMLVSHDRALLRSVCDEFWLVGRGVVADFDGDLDDYQRYLLDEAKRLREEAKIAVRDAAAAIATAAEPVAIAAPAPAASEPAAANKNPQQRKQDAQGRQQRSDQAKPIKREIAQIDERLAAAGTERAALEARLAQPLPSAEIAEAGKRLKALNDEIGRLEERWLALSDQLEALAA